MHCTRAQAYTICGLFLVVLAGNAFAQLPPPVIDETTRGSWAGTYGECGYALGAYDAPLVNCQTPCLDGQGVCLGPSCLGGCDHYDGGGSLDVLDCEPLSFDLDGDGVDDWRYKVYAGPNFGSSRVLMEPDGSCSGANGVWFNPRAGLCPGGGSDTMSYDITGLPAGQYRMSVYAMDWDGANARAQDIRVCVAGSCSGSAAVGAFAGGLYVRFDIDVAAGEDVSVTHTSTGSGNAVVQGVFFDPGTPQCANAKACYAGFGTEDRLSRGNWLWSYGSQGYILFNHVLGSMTKPPSGCLSPGQTSPTTVVGGFGGAAVDVVAASPIATWWWTRSAPDSACGKAMAWVWGCDDLSGRALENPAAWDGNRCGGVGQCAGGYNTAGTWNDAGERQIGGPDLFIDVEVDLPGSWELSFYAMDYDSSTRQQRFHLYEYHSYNPAAPVVDLGTYPGDYVTYTLEGPFRVTLRAEYYQGANALVSGIFLDPAPGGDCAGDPGTPACPEVMEAGDYCTYQQGAWGAKSDETVGTIRHERWNEVYPVDLGDSDDDGYGDVVIGSTDPGCKALTFTDPEALQAYLPCGGSPDQLQSDMTDPVCGKGRSPTKNTLASQLLSLRLNIDFSCMGVFAADFGDDDGELCLGDLSITQGPFGGMTVAEFLAEAELALSCGTLGPGLTYGDYNFTASGINENFSGCNTNESLLECPPAPAAPSGAAIYVTHDVGPDQDLNRDALGTDAVAGSRVDYALNVEVGDSDVDGVVVTNVLPSFELGDHQSLDLDSVTVQPSIGRSCSFDDATNELSCSLGSMAAGSKTTIRYSTRLNLLAPIGAGAENAVTVNAVNGQDSGLASAASSVFTIPGEPGTGPECSGPTCSLGAAIGTTAFWCENLRQSQSSPFDVDRVERWIADINFSSRWFDESKSLDGLQDAKKIVCGKPGTGSAKARLERNLLALWLDVASFNVWPDVRLEQLCLAGGGFPVGTDLKASIADVLVSAEQALLDNDGSFAFWREQIENVTAASSPVDRDGDGFNGLRLDPVAPFDRRFDGNACDAAPGDPGVQ